jgi:hypothetical protein
MHTKHTKTIIGTAMLALSFFESLPALDWKEINLNAPPGADDVSSMGLNDADSSILSATRVDGTNDWCIWVWQSSSGENNYVIGHYTNTDIFIYTVVQSLANDSSGVAESYFNIISNLNQTMSWFCNTEASTFITTSLSQARMRTCIDVSTDTDSPAGWGSGYYEGALDLVNL